MKIEHETYPDPLLQSHLSRPVQRLSDPGKFLHILANLILFYHLDILRRNTLEFMGENMMAFPDGIVHVRSEAPPNVPAKNHIGPC